MADLTSVRVKIQEAHDEASLALGVPTTAQVIAALTAERDQAVADRNAAIAQRDALQAKIDQVKAVVNG